MKTKILQFILLLFLSNLTFAQTNVYDSIFVGGRWRTFLTHLPTGYNTSNNYPLVLAFHGGGLLVPLVGKMLDKTKKGFQLMNESIKKECEKE